MQWEINKTIDRPARHACSYCCTQIYNNSTLHRFLIEKSSLLTKQTDQIICQEALAQSLNCCIVWFKGSTISFRNLSSCYFFISCFILKQLCNPNDTISSLLSKFLSHEQGFPLTNNEWCRISRSKNAWQSCLNVSRTSVFLGLKTESKPGVETNTKTGRTKRCNLT